MKNCEPVKQHPQNNITKLFLKNRTGLLMIVLFGCSESDNWFIYICALINQPYQSA